jgi:hypothetical protein
MCVGFGVGMAHKAPSTSRATRRLIPIVKMSARSASSVMRRPGPAFAS